MLKYLPVEIQSVYTECQGMEWIHKISMWSTSSDINHGHGSLSFVAVIDTFNACRYKWLTLSCCWTFRNIFGITMHKFMTIILVKPSNKPYCSWKINSCSAAILKALRLSGPPNWGQYGGGAIQMKIAFITCFGEHEVCFAIKWQLKLSWNAHS